MSPRVRHDVVVVAAIAFLVAYALPLFIAFPQLWYQPLERAWSYGARPEGRIVMDWYGRTLTASVVALIAAAVARPVMPRLRAHPRALAAGLGIVLAGALAAYAGHLHDRVVTPEPIPPGYIERR